jgi:hypothetical protein
MALSHAILAVLANWACSGYDLAKQFDGSVGFFWHGLILRFKAVGLYGLIQECASLGMNLGFVAELL